MDQTFATLLGTAVIVALGVLFSNSRVSDINSRLSDTNGRIDAMQQNMTLLIQAESAKLQSGIERIEGVLDARLRHVEEKLNSR
jgi:peptidoglycan hydrolase CwlO-like protein